MEKRIKKTGRPGGRSRSRRRNHRQARIRCVVTKAQQLLIERAAASKGISVSRFVAEAGAREAEAILGLPRGKIRTHLREE